MNKRKSPVINLLDLVYRNANDSTGKSYERLNHAMRAALSLAIGSGFKFGKDDINYIRSNYRSGYWIGDSDEWIYTEAVVVGNTSAFNSYEAAKNRQAFIADDVDCGQRHGYFKHSGGSWQKQRLAVGFTFQWKGLTLTVNSFANDQSYINACSHVDVKSESGYTTKKPDKRFKITRDDIITERAERKERQTLLDKLTATAEKDGNLNEIIKALGVKTKSDYSKLSIDKIRKVVSKFIAA